MRYPTAYTTEEPEGRVLTEHGCSIFEKGSNGTTRPLPAYPIQATPVTENVSARHSTVCALC